MNSEQAAEWTEIKTLKPWPGNPRKNEKRAPHVADLIKRFGFSEPIVARAENREVIAGHTRLKAVKLLVQQWPKVSARDEWHEDAQKIATSERVPARFMDIGEDEAHLLALADNRSTELTPWDDVALRKLLPSFSLEDVTLAGWTAEQLAKMLASKDAVVQELEVSMLRDEFWLSVRGPVPAQPQVLQALQRALASIEGVDVTYGITGQSQLTGHAK